MLVLFSTEISQNKGFQVWTCISFGNFTAGTTTNNRQKWLIFANIPLVSNLKYLALISHNHFSANEAVCG